MADENLLQRLREAVPSWQNAKLVTETTKSTGVDHTNIRKWEPVSFNSQKDDAATEAAVTPQSQAATTAASENNEYSFELELDSIDTEAYTIDIHVGYGEINDTPPDGMTGADDYILTIPGAKDGTEIYAIVTYDVTSLSITSRTLAFGDSVPDSTYGTLYIPIGFVDIAYDSTTGAIGEVNPHNRQCGDINFVLIYGEKAARPAVYAMPVYDGGGVNLAPP